MQSRSLYFIPAIIFFILTLLLGYGLGTDPRYLPSALIDKPVPVFSLPLLDKPREQLTQRDFIGHYSLIHIFSKECVVCQEERPMLEKMANTKKIPFYGIDYKDSRDQGLQWLRERANPYQKVGFDEEGKVSMDFGIYGTPETYLVDPRGVIRYKYVGSLTWDIWENEILPKLN